MQYTFIGRLVYVSNGHVVVMFREACRQAMPAKNSREDLDLVMDDITFAT